MTFYMNLKTGIETIPLKETTIRMIPGKPMQIDESIEAEFMQNAGDLIADGIIQRITEEKAQEYQQKWDLLKKIPAKNTKDLDSSISAYASYAREEARREGIDANVKKKPFIPAW